MAAEIIQYADPLNPLGWVLEPVRRRVALAFPSVEWSVRPVGMVESWETYEGGEIEGGRAGMAAVCARLSEQYGMPIDEYLWFDDPPTSSWPACRAIAAAGLQEGPIRGSVAAGRLLRACREATFARRTSVSDEDALRTIVREVPDLDAEGVAAALADGRADRAFEAARREAAALDLPGVDRAGDRCSLPTIVVSAEGVERGISGVASISTYVSAVEAVTDLTPAESNRSVSEVLEHFSPEGWVARVELARATGRPEATVAASARELVDSGDVIERTFAAEPFWRRAAYGEDSAASDDSGSV